jgi:hypothetical protein
VVRHFGEPLLSLGAGTGRQKPFLVDCHFVDAEMLAQQPQWADPATFAPEHTSRDYYLWLYAFDLAANGARLWGENPAERVRVYSPADYVPQAAADLRRRLAALKSVDAGPDPTAEVTDRWKLVAGETLRLLALAHGCRSLRKQEVYRDFHALVPYFQGKDFSASLWAEYLYGSVFQDREDWLARCDRFCTKGLALLP